MCNGTDRFGEVLVVRGRLRPLTGELYALISLWPGDLDATHRRRLTS